MYSTRGARGAALRRYLSWRGFIDSSLTFFQLVLEPPGQAGLLDEAGVLIGGAGG
jgi:hypothetical protein